VKPRGAFACPINEIDFQPHEKKTAKTGMGQTSYEQSTLVQRLKNGDLQALNELMNHHKDELYRAAYRILGNKEEAEEVLQDTFLRAYQKISTFAGKAKLSTWLYRICVNRCLNKLEGRRKHDPNPFAKTAENLPATNDTEAEYETAELQENVGRAIAQLKPDQRAIVSLYYLEGFSCGEISEILSQPAGTVKTHLFRARNNLKKLLAEIRLNHEA
jgi:RNA polymerase sigma-70 factor (ECF subfamily)